MQSTSFDTLIIGSGTSAYYCAHGLTDGGQRVAVIDERPFGGTCALRGCQPKKYLVANAEAVAAAAHLAGRGISSFPKTDWPALQALKNAFVDPIPEGTRKGFETAGITTISGSARMIGSDRVQVNGDILQADHVVIATGAVPRKSSIPGAEHVGDSETFLDLDQLPERVLFIGGGYISFEFAHVAARAGAQVTILHRSARPLKAFDPDMVAIIAAASRADGIDLVLEETATTVKREKKGLVITGKKGAVYETDLIIEASGRLPDLRVLDGGAAGVQTNANGVVVNDYLQSVSNPKVYAIGDAADRPHRLATVADRHGAVAADNILNGNRQTVDDRVVPTAVFTIPALAAVGMTEEKAAAGGLAYRVHTGSTADWPSSKRIGEDHAGYKVIVEKQTHRILGAHLARHNAAEAINIFAMAMQFGLTTDDLKTMLWAYPTYVSDLKYMIG